ncbi:hypothetical protein MAF45_07860 [Mesosutterella sp. OilRF-GAM-744-9]|uniref:ADP-heptose:LPS heptosyltransferase n=2 Tax=Mesosutterella TaxID=2494213 RepID=A0ABS9MRU0_9BURK|nr:MULTISPECIES: glycosyltransferase family 9 protein [unclassified Mesosutterella]MCG5031353.1 hypothetical protein [Mesosutterella sp. oilRF-744-WT-GAM-9]MDL2059473.1 glycosyltransferase family 9 protein [Mesosutterella sp. AGMB02718]
MLETTKRYIYFFLKCQILLLKILLTRSKTKQLILVDNVKNFISFSRNYRKINCDIIAVIADGGVGDCLIYLNYIYHLYLKLNKKVLIDFYFKSKKTPINLYKVDENYIHTFYDKKFIKFSKFIYPVIIQMKERFPKVIKCDKSYIRSEQLIDILEKYNKFYINNRFYYDYSPRIDGLSAQFSLAAGYNRVTQPDLFHLVSINDIEITIGVENERKILEKFKLLNSKFITFNRSVDADNNSENSTKLWPKFYYIELINKIKKYYPNLTIVFLGPKYEDLPLEGIKNLSGRTDFNELKVLLKNAIIHIGPEGGMIHLRHALSRKVSCVLFGPTSKLFYGYQENINLLNESVCKVSCEWLIENWQRLCLNNCTNECNKLLNLKPDFVFSKIDNAIKLAGVN